jgi:hypothetical protein
MQGAAALALGGSDLAAPAPVEASIVHVDLDPDVTLSDHPDANSNTLNTYPLDPIYISLSY